MEIIELLGADKVVTFMLLFARIGGLMVFFPFFSHNQIPITIKIALNFILSIFLFPISTVPDHTVNFFVIDLLSEVLLGLCSGLLLSIVFSILQFAGEQIAMVMGISIATVLDPQSNINSPIISNMLNFLSLLIFLSFDGHHILLYFFSISLYNIPLGEFYPHHGLMKYIVNNMINLFIFGFILAFPIIALSLLSDLIFGMLMKTMPQFNLLVIGYPIKITIGIIVLIAVLSSMMEIFKKLVLGILNDFPDLFFSLSIK